VGETVLSPLCPQRTHFKNISGLNPQKALNIHIYDIYIDDIYIDDIYIDVIYI
jgi:hypothetical protein